MVGINVSAGAVSRRPPARQSPQVWTGAERPTTFDDGRIGLTAWTHPGDESRPATTSDGDVLWWVCGDVYAVDTPHGTRPVPGRDPAEVCARHFEAGDLGAVPDLNGTFAAVGYDADAGEVHLVTDRLGTHPLYYARGDGGLLVSTHVQSIAGHPAVEARVDPELLAEYCSLGRVTGLRTPLEGVEALPPSTVTTVDLDTLGMRRWRYWSPQYEPTEAPFSEVAARFSGTLERVVRERLVEGRRYGFLVSGGSDSRLLLDIALDELDPSDVVIYHLSDWMSDEARMAERVALTAGAEFRWLRRGEDYQEATLRSAPSMMNFYGRFEQAHTAGFTDRLREEVDELVTGLYADTFFRALPLPRRSVDLGRAGTLYLPSAVGARSIDDYLRRYPEEPPAFVDADRGLREILRDHLAVREDGTVVDHGVPYPSLRELAMYVDVYPLWNDPDLFYWGLGQTMPHWTPFLDDRMVDLALSVPLRYQLRRNLSNAALRRRGSPFAAFPVAETGVSPSRSFPVHTLGRWLTALWRRTADRADPPQPYYTHHPWTNIGAVLNHQAFPGDVLRRRQSAIRAAPFLDWEGVLESYRTHLETGEGSESLYTLLSLIEMPAFEEFLPEGSEVPDRGRIPTEARENSPGSADPALRREL